MASFQVPPLGESIVEATVSRWLKNEGDAVAAGDTLVELETDKITVEVPALEAGTLSKRLKSEGDVVNVGDVLGELTAGAGSASSAGSAPAASAPAASAPAASAPAAAPAASSSGGTDPKASPAARRLATEQGTDLAQVAGSGRGGVVSKADVVAAGKDAPKAEAPKPAAPRAPSAPAMPRSTAESGERETREKMSTRRKRIAENLLQSQHNTAHLTTFNEIDMTAVSALRERMRDKVEKEHGLRLSYMPFFAKAACLALEAFPAVNAQIDGDHFVYHHYVNLGIAVASDAGLVVPNVKDAQARSLIGIGHEIDTVAKQGA